MLHGCYWRSGCSMQLGVRLNVDAHSVRSSVEQRGLGRQPLCKRKGKGRGRGGGGGPLDAAVLLRRRRRCTKSCCAGALTWRTCGRTLCNARLRLARWGWRAAKHRGCGTPERGGHLLRHRLLLLLDHAVKVVLVLPQVLLLLEVLALGLQALLLEVGERRSRGSRGLAD